MTAETETPLHYDPRLSNLAAAGLRISKAPLSPWTDLLPTDSEPHRSQIVESTSVEEAQRNLIDYLYANHTGSTLHIIASVVGDLNNPLSSVFPLADIEMFDKLGLLMSKYGTQHYGDNQRSLLRLSASCDLRFIHHKINLSGGSEKVELLASEQRHKAFISRIRSKPKPTPSGMRK